MIKLFKPEDFNVWVNDHPYYKSGDPLLLDERIAKAANQILQREVEKWPVVYDGNSGLSLSNSGTWSVVKHDEKDHIAISSNFTNSKRKARLAFIEEIKKECTKHEPKAICGVKDNKWFTAGHRCIHCDKDIVAEWKAL